MKSVIIVTFTVENYWDKATPDNSLWNQFEKKLQKTVEQNLDAENVVVLAVSPEDVGIKFQLGVPSMDGDSNTTVVQKDNTDFFTKIKNKVKFTNE